MTDFQSTFLRLICASINGDFRNISKKFDFDSVYEFCIRHNIASIVYYGTIRIVSVAGYNCCRKYYQHTCNMIVYEPLQAEVLNELKKAFSENDIEYILGGRLTFKDLYIYPEMCEAEKIIFIVKDENYRDVAALLSAMGYNKQTEESKHTEFLSNSGIKVVITAGKDAFLRSNLKIPNDVWERAVNKKANEYVLKPKYKFYYNFLEFTDQFIKGEAKIADVIDIYLLKRACTKRDLRDVSRLLAKHKLKRFYENMLDLFDVWFDGGYPSGAVDIITDKIFNIDDTVHSAGIKLKRAKGFKEVLHAHRSLFKFKRNGDELITIGLYNYISNK